MQEYSAVGERISGLRERIGAAAARSGREPSGVTLMAVTKLHPAAAVLAAYDAGIRVFGENRVQEARDKYSALREELPESELHMIGGLQSNKVGKAIEIFSAIQSVDSIDLLERIVGRTQGNGSRLPGLFLEVHTGEDTKSGFTDDEELFRACARIEELGGTLRLRGLMTMAPFTDDEGRIRASFSRARSLRDAILQRFSLPGFGELSMGMSGDFEIAVEEGSTMVRIGTAIFGGRA